MKRGSGFGIGRRGLGKAKMLMEMAYVAQTGMRD
jgi:hypothetical protein